MSETLLYIRTEPHFDRGIALVIQLTGGGACVVIPANAPADLIYLKLEELGELLVKGVRERSGQIVTPRPVDTTPRRVNIFPPPSKPNDP